MSLKNRVFGCEGKITLFSFPKEPSVTWRVDAVCFLGAATEFLKCVCWRTFYKQSPVRHGICTSFDTERWSGPSYKRSRTWFGTADGKWNHRHNKYYLIFYVYEWNGIKCLCFVGDRLKCSSLFSSAHGAPPGARLFSERIVKLYLSFINMIKLKTFWRYEGCSTTRAGRYISCDMHAHLVSKVGSLISG